MASALRVAGSQHRTAACVPSTSGRPLCPITRVTYRGASSRGCHPQRAVAQDDYLSERRADEEYMKEYQGLKDQLMDNTRKCGAVVAAYLLLTADGQAALCALLGSAAGYAYLALLYRDVDSYKADTVVPMVLAEEIDNPVMRWTAKLLAAYRQALNGRLLVPVGLAVLGAAYNRLAGPEAQLDLLHQGCLLGGFLSYKLALLIKLVDELTPKTYVDTTDTRPRLEPVEDELDMYGRPKRRVTRLPTEVLPEGVEADKVPLAGLILAAEAEAAAEAQKEQGQQPTAGTR